MTTRRLNSRLGAARANVLKIGLLALSALGTIALGACSRGNADAPQGTPTMPVKVQAVQDHPIGDASEYVATIKSRHSATIMSDVEGWIFDIHVHSGQLVKKGDTLMEIDPRRQRAAVSNYDSAEGIQGSGAGSGPRCSWSATRRLAASGVVSKQDLRPGASEL